MIEAINFLKEELASLYNAHKYLEIRYEFDSLIDTHIIEVKPAHCFEKDRVFADRQIELEEKFRLLFPNEDILFITENILIKLENPLLELGVCNHVLEGEVFQTIIRAKRYPSSVVACSSYVLVEPPTDFSNASYVTQDPNGSFSL